MLLALRSVIVTLCISVTNWAIERSQMVPFTVMLVVSTTDSDCSPWRRSYLRNWVRVWAVPFMVRELLAHE